VSDLPNPFPKLPHAHPFLLVDRVIEVEERRGTFLKLVSASDPCIAPDDTLPAAFLLEALAQAAGALIGAQSTGGPELGYLAAVDDFQTSGDVKVGDELYLDVEIMRHFSAATLFRGRARVGDRVVAEGRFTLALPRMG